MDEHEHVETIARLEQATDELRECVAVNAELRNQVSVLQEALTRTRKHWLDGIMANAELGNLLAQSDFFEREEP